jgi:hypothetical protein
MTESECAWRLWQLLRMLVDMLWEYYQDEFTEFSTQERMRNKWRYLHPDEEDLLPF